MSTTDNLALALIETSQAQKEVTANQAFAALDAAICETLTFEVADGANEPTAAQVREAVRLLLAAGSPAPSGPVTLTLPTVKRLLIISNECGESVTVECDGGSETVTVTDGSSALVYCDAAEVYSIASGGASSALGINAQTGTTYTLVLSDAGKLVTLDNGSPITLTVPADSTADFPVGTQILLAQLDAGQVTVEPESTGVEIITPETYALRKAGAQAALVKIGADTWLLEGNLEAA